MINNPPKTGSVRSYTKSSSFKMALLFTLLCGLSLFTLGYFGYFFARGHFIHGTEAIIDTEIKYLTTNQQYSASENNDRLFIPFGSNGEPPALVSGKVQRLKEGMIVFNDAALAKTYAAKVHTFPNNKKILVAVDITETQQQFRLMKWLSLISMALIMLVVLVSYLISVFVAKSTNKIANTAQNIMETGDLSKRLEVSSHWDDLGNMSSTLNLMLDRIESLMGGVRQVSDNIAHDLRTPLTRLRNHIEAAKKDNSEAANDALLNEADHLLNTFNALLRISRIETEKKREHFQVVALRPLLEDVIAFYEPLAETKRIALRYQLVEATCAGDKDLLFQAYANILDNAIKYTPEGGYISINMEHDGMRYIIAIEDSGGGIAKNDLNQVFQRFYRGDVSRSSAGTGLGLSLVKAVFDLHNVQITLENTDNGLKFITKM
jgi:signal transduction histidine kinase